MVRKNSCLYQHIMIQDISYYQIIIQQLHQVKYILSNRVKMKIISRKKFNKVKAVNYYYFVTEMH